MNGSYSCRTPGAVTAIKLLMLTGARLSEILTLKWRDVDIKAGKLNLPDSKTGEKTILLSPPAADILNTWPKWAKSPYVFPGEGHGKRKGEHRVDLKDAWAWARKRAKIPDVRLHDLRHSFASVAVSSGLTLPMIGALLGHTQAQTTQRYAHLLNDPLRAASNATAGTIAEAITRRVADVTRNAVTQGERTSKYVTKEVLDPSPSAETFTALRQTDNTRSGVNRCAEM